MKNPFPPFVFCLLFLSALSALSALHAQQARPTIAILPFTGGTGQDGETIAELFSFEQVLTAAFAPVPRTSINRAIRGEQRFQLASGMTDSDTIIALGRQLGARYVVAGSITALGGQRLLIISIIDVERLQQIAGDYQPYAQIEEIQGRLPAMARNIAQAARADTSKLPRLAVLPFELGNGANARDADALAQVLAVNIIRSGKYAVYPRTAGLEQVQAEYANQMTGDTADENIARMGAGENPGLALSGAARRLGTARTMFNAAIINLGSGVQEQGASVNYQSLEEGLRVMEGLAIRLTGTAAEIAARERAEQEERERPAREQAERERALLRPIRGESAITGAEAFREALALLDAAGEGNYTLLLGGSFAASGIVFAANAQKTVTIRGDSQVRTITNNGGSALVSVPANITLILGNNVRLDGGGRQQFTVSIMGGTVRMEAGSAVANSGAGGVYFYGSEGGAFIMSGGTISGNSGSGVHHGGGGTFTMRGGTISGNGSSGVSVGRGTFTMSGGTISGNSAAYPGGGVRVQVDFGGIFIKTGGTIDSTNSARGRGRVVYISCNGNNRWRERTSGPRDNLNSQVDGRAGGWD